MLFCFIIIDINYINLVEESTKCSALPQCIRCNTI